MVGIWVADKGYKTVELLFRSGGHYQADTRSADPGSDFDIADRGRYQIDGQSLTFTSYQYYDHPSSDTCQIELDGDLLSVTDPGSDLTGEYQLQPGSREDVLAREQLNPDLFRRWTRQLMFVGDEEFTFRPGGYYFVKTTRDSGEFPPEFVRGRFNQAGTQVTFKPYSAAAAGCEVDLFGTTLTLIETNGWSGGFTSYEEVPGSATEVAAKTAEAQAYLRDPNWEVGVWQIHDRDITIDLTLRPDGIYSATNSTATVRRILRGRFTLADGQIHLVPFIGQERHTLDDANFGIAEQTYTLDYYDSELQLIDLKAVSQSVTLARETPGTQSAVLELAREAQAERARDGWYVGVWEINSPAGWMEFTFRPDNRYLAKSGAGGVASEVERGQYRVAAGKITLAPYPGNGSARGFELDLYDGELSLIGDSQRLVMLRKVAGSETAVIEKTLDPLALKGERGSILGLWTANRPEEWVELVFRPDGQFRLKRCSYNLIITNNAISTDYGLYTVDMATRTLVYDSRFVAVQTQQLDFYGDTMTIYGGLTNSLPTTYTANLGTVDAAIAASFAADAEEAQVDAQWLARVPIAAKDPNAVQDPGLPADPHPEQIFDAPTVFSTYQFYRRVIPSVLFYPNADGTLDQLAVFDTQQWHFFPTGRVLIRFTHYSVGFPYPMTTEDVKDTWGAYEIGPKPTQTDILHCYADNVVNIKLDVGDEEKLTLENGRRNLFWGKECQVSGAWAAEDKPIVCQLPGDPDTSLINTGVSLATDIAPDAIGEGGTLEIVIARPVPGTMTVSGSSDVARNLVLERAASLVAPVWESVGSNSVPAGPFSFTIPEATNGAAFFRIRSQ